MRRICFWRRAFKWITAPLFVLLCSLWQTGTAEAPRIGIYYLDDVATTPYSPDDLFNLPHGRTEALMGELVLSDSDIVDYCWRSHSVRLTPEAAQRLPKSGWPKLSTPIPESELVGLRGTPFVLMVDEVRCYSGAFWTHRSSFATREPVFMVDTLKEFLPATSVNPAPQGRFQIELGYPSRPPTHAEDVRDCPSLKKALVEMGKLRKGC